MKVKYLILATLFYTLITGLITFPLFFNLNKGIFGYKGDNMNQMHDIWFANSLTILTVNYYGYFMLLLTFLILIYLTIKKVFNN
ncbi:MAG: hypothetical protein ABIB98_00935 [bacterium]